MDSDEKTDPDDVDLRRWRKEISQLFIGATDDDGDKITLVFSVTDEFAVYITPNGVKHATRQPITGCLASIAKTATELNHYRSQFPFVDIAVAQAKAICFARKEKDAQEILAAAHQRVLQLLTGAGRLRYVLVCMLASAFVVTTVSVLSHFPLPEQHVFTAWMGACGSIGAFLSVSLNLKSLQIDPVAAKMMTTISAASRIVIGVIGAIFMLLVIKGNLVLGLLKDLQNSHALLAIGILAGFSETFVPNVLRRVETQADVAANKAPPKKPLQPMSDPKA